MLHTCLDIKSPITVRFKCLRRLENAIHNVGSHRSTSTEDRWERSNALVSTATKLVCRVTYRHCPSSCQTSCRPARPCWTCHQGQVEVGNRFGSLREASSRSWSEGEEEQRHPFLVIHSRSCEGRYPPYQYARYIHATLHMIVSQAKTKSVLKW